MKKVTVHEAKTHLSRLIQEVLRGGAVVILRGKRPVVELRAVGTLDTERKLGDYEDRIRISKDFGLPLPDFDDYR